jgi:diguanylate cyclase (GGDEF)-like protein
MRDKLRNKFLTFVNYEWDRGYRENIEDVAYENAVLTWNGMFIMVVVDIVLMLYYATTGHDSMQAIRYACTLPVIFVISVFSQMLYRKHQDKYALTTWMSYIYGTFVLLFCMYMIVVPDVRASFYAFFLVMTLQTTLIVDVPRRKLLMQVIWFVMMLIANSVGVEDPVRFRSVLIHGVIVTISSYLFGCFTTWRKLQGFDNARELLYISTHDRLTRLKNRDCLYRDFDEWSAAGRIRGVIIFDINSFKHLNDTYGHIFGDQAIQYVAGILHVCEERYGISFYRYGGDEFVGLVLTDGEKEPGRLITHIKHRVSEYQLCTVDGVEITIQVSGGYEDYQTGMSLEQCVNVADEVMYADK